MRKIITACSMLTLFLCELLNTDHINAAQIATTPVYISIPATPVDIYVPENLQAVQTGDQFCMLRYILILVITFICILILTYKKKNSKKEGYIL